LLVAAHTPSTLSTNNSASLMTLMSVEADTGLRHAHDKTNENNLELEDIQFLI